ncbi:type I polyketide synthase, partial [Cohnella silvisoli]
MEKAWWDADDILEEESEIVEETSHRDIAIIGMSVRLPGVCDVQSLWELIAAGHDAIGPFPDARRADVESLLSSTKLPNGKVSYYDGAYLDEIDKFDYRFFRMSPKEASLMSPNQRLWLETAWSALEDAGYGASKLAGSRTGVYLGYNGDAFHDYKRLISERDPASLTQGITGNLSSIVASRISYLLDFRGPSLTVDTACSSSLVALHIAIQSLRAGECEQALVGGVKTYLLPVDLGIRIGIESPDFRARTFDDRSAGTGGGEGAAAILIKPLGKALRDKDAIYAVIKGSAINQDGSSIGITAPNGRAQEEVIVQAWEDADIDPATIGYVEAHGTGTKLGDPIEIDGMTQAFRRYTRRSQFCAVGSVKTNFGHLDTTAGIVGLIKTALALHRRELPPMLHFREPNREIPFLDSPVYVSDILRPWAQDEDHPRRAGVSSFGMSGTNAHAVLEEAPSIPSLQRANESAKVQPFALSAKSETALAALVVSYEHFLERHDHSSLSLGSLCYTANTGRGHYEFRAAVTVGSIEQLRDKLRLLAKCLLEGKKPLAFGELEGNAREWEDGSGVPTGIWLGRHGGGNDMSALARAAASVDTLTEDIRDSSAEKLCLAYAEGNRLDWEAWYRDSGYGKIHLPTYPFDRTRCWVEERTAYSDYRKPNDNEGKMALSVADAKDRDIVQLIGREEDRYSETEKTVALIWGRALGFESIGVYDHYYELGGDSILALQIVGELSSAIGREIEIADLLGHPTVADLSVYIDGVMGISIDKADASQELIGDDSEETMYPLSRAQHRIFLGAQLPGEERHHHMPLAYIVEGELQAVRLEMAFRKLAERHESLRTTFEWSEEGEPRQRVHPVPDMRIEPASVGSEADWSAFAAAFIRPFDMSKLPLVRIGLATVSPKRHLLVLDAHHLVADGASLALLLQELTALYEGLSLPPKSMDYRHYVHWQQDQKDSPVWQAQRAYWLSDMLSPPISHLRLPLDFPRPHVKSPEGKSFRFTLSEPLTDKLNQLARKRQVSLHTVLYSLYAVLMNRYSGQEEIMIGSLVSGRDQAAFRQIVGVFINFLPVRILVSARLSFDEFMEGIQDLTSEAYSNGQFPFDEMVAATPAARDRSRNALYDTMLVFHNHSTGSDRFSSGGLLFSEYPLERTTSSLDVKLDLFPGSGGELHGVLEYDPQLFLESSISRMSEHFAELAAMAADHSDWAIGEFRLFGADEEANLESRRSLNDRPPQETVEGLDFNLTIASTFTSEPIAKSLTRWLGEFGLKSKLSFAPYNQIVQHVIGEHTSEMESTGAKGTEEANVLLIRPEDWLTKAATVEERLEQLESDLRRLMRLLGERKEHGTYFVALMPFSANGPFNELSEQAAGAFRERWSDLVLSAENVNPLDFSVAAARYRVDEMEDPVANEEGHIPYTEQYFAAIGTEIARALIAWRATPFKVIVVDADNTLWRGVCGEEGALNVQVTQEFAAWQRLLLRKRSEGMLLALCSKNNEDDLWEVFARNPGMMLRKEHFSAWRVNWESKADNLRELSAELNLGLDSFIFVDDNAVECLSVMAGCPEVLTLKLPEEGEMTAFLSHVWAWDRLNVTEEDRRRAGSYEAERQRKEAVRPGVTLDNYLQGLGMKVSMRALSSEDTERAAQLSVRTNQFNLNGIRRSKEDIRALLIGEQAYQWVVEAADRYGDYGKIGYVSATRDGSSLVLNAFLLSCRVLGRGVEQAVCTGLKRFASSLGCVELRAEFRRTAKNRPFEQFLEDSGWVMDQAETEEEGSDCYIDLTEVNEMPRHIAFYDRIPYEIEEAYELTAAAAGQYSLIVAEAGGQTRTKSRSFDWVLSYDREPEVLHRAYYSPLRYPDASLIASLEDVYTDVNRETRNQAIALSYERPVSDTESKMAELWAKLLGGGPYGRNDHFFAVGGDSLQAASLVSAFVRTFGVRVSLSDLFDHARLKEMAALMCVESNDKKQTYEAIPIASKAELYPVSPAQRRMYFLQQFEPTGTAYQIPTALMLTGPVDREGLRQAFHELTRRHEGLRTSFRLHEDEPYQCVHDVADFEIMYKEMADNGELIEQALRDFVRPFDLSRAPLFRVGLFRLDQGRHVMVFDIHHIVADGVSVNVLMEDFLMLYEGHSLMPSELQYKDYSTWLLGEERAGRYSEQLDSWIQSFSEPLPKLELPADFARPEVKSTIGAQLLVHLTARETEQLNRLAQRSGTTLFMVLLTAYASWLMKLSGQTDMIIGTPVAGRSHPDTGKLVGVFVNPLAIRIASAADFTFEELLGYVKETVINALDRQEAPFEELVERLRPERDLSRNPIFDTMFSMLNMFHADASSAEIKIEQLPIDFGVSQFDIGLYAVEEVRGLNFIIQYASGLFRSGTMQRWVDGFQVLLGAISKNPELKLNDISILSEEEHHQVVNTFNATIAPFPRELTLPELFRRQAEAAPDKLAAS